MYIKPMGKFSGRPENCIYSFLFANCLKILMVSDKTIHLFYLHYLPKQYIGFYVFTYAIALYLLVMKILCHKNVALHHLDCTKYVKYVIF